MTFSAPSRTIRVAIIGAGPAGFYAAIELVKKVGLHIEVDLFERLPAPFGLVRHGVAPDHLSIKKVVAKYVDVFATDRVRMFAHVNFGTDVTHADLKVHYDAIVYAVGAQTDRPLGIPGENLAGSLSATSFVAWYNGHPEFTDVPVDTHAERVAVIGMGNVALDVARILAKTHRELHPSDIAPHALELLKNNQIKEIHVIGRRGPVQAKWTLPELKEMADLEVTDIIVDAQDMALDPISEAERASDKVAAKNYAQMQVYAARPPAGKPRQVHFRFWESPVEILGEDGKVTAIKLERNQFVNGKLRGTGEFEVLPVSMVLRSVGYRGVALPEVPFDETNGIIPNEQGRVLNPETGTPLPFEYVAGWIKRGPCGVIGTNKMDACESMQAFFEDLTTLPLPEEPRPDITPLLESRNVDFIDYEHWQVIDHHERTLGSHHGRPRVKLVDKQVMIDLGRSKKM